MKIYVLFFLVLVGCIHTVPIQQDVLSSRFATTPVYRGFDILGLARQNVSQVNDRLLPNTAIGVLEGTFGEVIPPLRTLLVSGNVSTWRSHLANYTCIRNHNCSTGEISPTNYAALAERARNFENLHREFPNIPCFLSPFLEYDVTDKSIVNKWFSVVKENAPSCTPVASAYKGWVPPGVLVEKHGNSAKADIISNDGQSFFDSNTDSYLLSGNKISFAWWYRCNLRTSGEKSWTPPKQRTARIQSDELNQARYLLVTSKPLIPKFSVCPKGRQLKSPEVWKTRSEDYNGKDVRENKPTLIVKGTYSRGFVGFSPEGKRVACLKYYGSYSGLSGYYRYYIGNCSGQNPEELFRDAGNQEYVCFKNGSTQLIVSSLRRSGSFR